MLGMNIFTSLLYFFIFSLLLNIILIKTINLGFLGQNFKNKLKYLLDNHLNLLTLFAFCTFLLAQYTVSLNTIYLDSDSEIVVKTVLENSKLEIKGEAIQIIASNFGSAAVFAASIRIAAALVSKSKLGLLPKAGFIGGTGAGFTILYKIISPAPLVNTNIGSASVVLSPAAQLTGVFLEKIEHINKQKPINDLLSDFFDLRSNTISNFKFQNHIDSGLKKEFLVDSDQNTTSKVLKALDETNPNWRDMFASSPLDNSENLQFFIDLLTNHLLLNYIILYLLIMLLIILIIKLLVANSPEKKRNITARLEKIKKYPLGRFIAYVVENYVYAWVGSSNAWIFCLNISLIIFTSGCIYSIINIISFLLSIKG